MIKIHEKNMFWCKCYFNILGEYKNAPVCSSTNFKLNNKMPPDIT